MASCQAAITPALRYHCQPIASSSMALKAKKKEETGKKEKIGLNTSQSPFPSPPPPVYVSCKTNATKKLKVVALQ